MKTSKRDGLALIGTKGDGSHLGVCEEPFNNMRNRRKGGREAD
jgi:hypothetical protein